MPLVVGVEQTSCRLPHLRGVVGQELACDDLVDGDVEARIDRLTADEHLLLVVLDRLRELLVFGKDEEVAVIRVGGIASRLRI